MEQYIDSNRQTHDALGYEVNATQHVGPFDYSKKWFLQSYGNTYSFSEHRIAIRHYYGFGNMARWTCVTKYRTDRHYTIEIYDSVEIGGNFYNRPVYSDIAYNLRDAVNMVRTHKSDK